VAFLAVPLLLATRSIARDADAEQRHTALGVPMVALVAAIMVSAASRLQLYVHYYGLTTDRFYPLVFMGWLALVLLWLGATVLRGWGRPFVVGAALSGLGTLAALNIANPDAIVARVNLARGETAVATDRPPVDVAYLASLSGDAVGYAIEPTLAPPRGAEGTPLRAAEDRTRCSAANTLVNGWGPSSHRARSHERPASWRNTSAGEVQGLRDVAAKAPALSRVAREACAAVQAERRANEQKSAATPTPGAVPPPPVQR
jgi:hypothetical protein